MDGKSVKHRVTRKVWTMVEKVRWFARARETMVEAKVVHFESRTHVLERCPKTATVYT